MLFKIGSPEVVVAKIRIGKNSFFKRFDSICIKTRFISSESFFHSGTRRFFSQGSAVKDY